MRFISLEAMRVFVQNDAEERILRAREAFVDAYCKEHGLDKEDLSFERILEIRNQPGWKNP